MRSAIRIAAVIASLYVLFFVGREIYDEVFPTPNPLIGEWRIDLAATAAANPDNPMFAAFRDEPSQSTTDLQRMLDQRVITFTNDTLTANGQTDIVSYEVLSDDRVNVIAMGTLLNVRTKRIELVDGRMAWKTPLFTAIYTKQVARDAAE